MNSALIKRLRKIATLEAEDYGAEPQDHSSWQAADLIESLRQQLAAALAACKLKDDLLNDIDVLNMQAKLSPYLATLVRKALAIQPDDSALKAWLEMSNTADCRSQSSLQGVVK